MEHEHKGAIRGGVKGAGLPCTTHVYIKPWQFIYKDGRGKMSPTSEMGK